MNSMAAFDVKSEGKITILIRRLGMQALVITPLITQFQNQRDSITTKKKEIKYSVHGNTLMWVDDRNERIQQNKNTVNSCPYACGWW